MMVLGCVVAVFVIYELFWREEGVYTADVSVIFNKYDLTITTSCLKTRFGFKGAMTVATGYEIWS